MRFSLPLLVAVVSQDTYWKWSVKLSNKDGEESSLLDTNAIQVVDDDQVVGFQHCSNGKLDAEAEYGETDVDCGGSRCGPCRTDFKCVLDSDCVDGKCIGVGNRICAPKVYSPNQRIRVASNTTSGATYVLGKYEGSATFTQESSISTTTVFVSEMNSDGQWQGNVLTIEGNANGNALKVVSDGVIVVGDFMNTVFFGANIMLQPCPKDADGNRDSNCYSNRRIFVAKFSHGADSKLVWDWAVEAGSSGGSSGAYGAAEAADALYITGGFCTGNPDGGHSITFGKSIMTSNSKSFDFEATDVFVAKMHKNGTWIWGAQIGGPSRDRGSDIICPTSIDTGCVVVGHIGGNTADRFGTEAGTPWPTEFINHNGLVGDLVSGGGDDIFVAAIKENQFGNGIWQWALQGNGSGADRGLGIVELPDRGIGEGEFAITGYFGGRPSPYKTSTTRPGITFASTLQNAGSESSSDPFGKDIFVATFVSDGNAGSGTKWGWAVGNGGLKDDMSYGIAAGDGRAVVIAGHINSDFRPYTFGSDSFKCEGTSDFFVAAASSGATGTGQWDWAVSGGGTGADAAYSISESASKTVVVAGASTKLPVAFRNRDLNVEMQISDTGGTGEGAFFISKIASDIPPPTPSPTYAPTPEMALNENLVDSLDQLVILMQNQGKNEYREYVMAPKKYAWPTHPDAQAQFMNIDKEMWIKGGTDNPKETIFDGQHITRFFRVVKGGKLTISNIQLKSGRSSEGGGALQVDPEGFLHLKNCHLDGNSATGERSGGALQVAQYGDKVGIAVVRESRFSGNKAAAYGGGAIYNSGRISVLSSSFVGNNAGTYGGDAFYMCGQTQLLDRTSFFQNRPSGEGTGIQNTFFVCKGADLGYHLTGFKDIGKDGTGDLTEKQCDRSEELTFDQFQRFSACVSAAPFGKSASLSVVLLAGVLALAIQQAGS